jgi:septal ring factor EnvC (AmiA/AmiB activator)
MRLGLVAWVLLGSSAAAAQGRSSVLAELETLEVQLIRSDSELASATTRLRELEGRVEALEAGLQTAEDAVHERRERTALRLRAMYRFRHRGFLPLLFAAESPHELLQSARYFLRVVRDDERALRRWNENLAAARALETELATEQDALLRAAGVAHMRREETRTLRDQQRGLLAKAPRVERERYRKRRIARAGATLEFTLDLTPEDPPDDIEVESMIPKSTFARSRGLLAMPAVGPVEPSGRGIDILAKRGAKIRAVHGGEVLKSLWIAHYGRVLILDHGEGWTTTYGHAERFEVGPGERISAGQVLGFVGDTGSLDGHRLHFEVRRGREAQDPLDWLRVPAGIRIKR